MKTMKRTILLLLCAVGMLSGVYAQQESPDVRKGNKQYKKQDFTAAEVDYRRGLEKNANSFEAHYNLGNALFKQDKYPEAQEEYQKAAQLIENKDNKQQLSESYHNLGNAFFAQQQYDKAVAAYKESLRNNPKDNDTRYNLVKAMQMLQQQQQQQQNQDQNQDKQNQDQQQQQQNQDQNKDDQQQDQQNHDQQEQQQQDQQEQQDDSKMDKETAEQILQALEQDEQQTQEKMQRSQGQKRRVEKDW